MADEKQIILITGANSGIGYATARELIADKTKHVLLCSRTREKGSKAVEELVALQQPGSVELLQLDVTDQASLDAAAQHVRDTHGRVDCIVNNAGTAGAGSTREDLRVCFETNAAGAWFVVETFAELLRKAVGTPRIVNVSSGLGSLALRAQKGSMLDDLSMIQYRASKAALNMMTVDQAVMYGKEGVKVFSYCPGYCESNLSEQNRIEYGAKPAAEGARPLVDIINGVRDEESGRFLRVGGQYDW